MGLLCILFLLSSFLHPANGIAKTAQFDLVYIWDTNLESVLDYKEELESLLSPAETKRLKVVGRGKEYGIIADQDRSAHASAQAIVRQSEILRQAGLDQVYAVKDQDYNELYNVSYSLGPNLAALKKTYQQIYSYLGENVGKDLFIEQISADNYALIYRRRGDRKSTYTVAKRHAKLLRKKKISTSITLENNNPVVYGEASLLDTEEDAEIRPKTKVIAQKPIPEKIKEQIVITQTAIKTPVKNVQEDTDFEQNIEQFIKGLRDKGTISRDERTSWMVYDLTRDKSLVDINADSPFQAASMIKPFVALAFFHQVKKGNLTYGPKSRKNMEAMIQRSNNSATNWVMKQVGGPTSCEKILQREYGQIFKNTRIKEYIPANGRTYKNSALPSDYVRFLKALWDKELPYGKELRRLMALPGRDRLYHGTPIPQGTLVYNKTGSTAHLCGDMGILAPRSENGRRYPYAIIAIIERESRPQDYSRWMLTRGNVIRQVSTLVYQEMKKKYKLL